MLFGLNYWTTAVRLWLMVHSFIKKYSSIYNSCFPLKKFQAKRYTLYKPWITRALLKSIKRKNTLYKRFLNNPTPSNEYRYKCFKNKLNHSLRIAKRLYYEKKKLKKLKLT